MNPVEESIIQGFTEAGLAIPSEQAIPVAQAVFRKVLEDGWITDWDMGGSHRCHAKSLEIVKDFGENWSHRDGMGSTEGITLRRCSVCGEYWAYRHQHDPGTGSDDWAKRLGFNRPETLPPFSKKTWVD